MTMQYVRDAYHVPVRRHSLVRPIVGAWRGYTFVVTSCSNHVHARMSSNQIHAGMRCGPRGRRFRFHPADLEYKTATGWVRLEGE